MKKAFVKTSLFLSFLLIYSFTIGENKMTQQKNPNKKMIILGMDGLDPNLLEKFMAEGHLPHFQDLAKTNHFRRLKTSNPPQSPVAWSCLISGHNPGHHDIFDFVIRNPETYLPEISMTEVKKTSGGAIRQFMAGLTGQHVQNRRKGKAFWDYLGDNGISSVILRCPVTFPATSLNGHLLSGMGTPDIRGTQGISTHFTDSIKNDPETHARLVKVGWENKKIKTVLTGPKVKSPTKSEDVTVSLEIERVNPKTIKITLEGQSAQMTVGSWSPWFRVKFKAGLMNDIYGICKFHLSSLEPEFSLLATPINLDPQSPAFPISYPTDYAKQIFEKMGNYYTQGMPYDTWSLNEGRLTEEKFLEQAYQILDENKKTLQLELPLFKSGVLFCYFGATDLIQHMFWRHIDPEHPNKSSSSNSDVKNAILNIYKRMDEVIAETQKHVDDNTTLIILSDHGFGSFRRSVHINSWLHDKGYLVFQNNEGEGKEFFANVDWKNTRAYSLGFGGIYINQFGREKEGIVYKGRETNDLKKEISKELKAWQDQNGASVVRNVYSNEDLYKGPYSEHGPDLFIGFDKNYRASWQTGLGAAPEELIEDNTRAWSGDHLCDPDLVPGVLISNKEIKNNIPSLTDIAPTILQYFNVQNTGDFEGSSFY